MNNKEFFDILIVSGKINNVKTENIEVLYDSKIYVGDLGKLVINKSKKTFIQIMRICDSIIRIYNDDKKSEHEINKLKHIIEVYLRFLGIENTSKMVYNIILFISYIKQGGKVELTDYITFCKVVQLLSKDYLIDNDKRHTLERKATVIDDFKTFRVDSRFNTPLIKISGDNIKYFKTDKIPNSETRVNKIKELIQDENIDLIITPYDEGESQLLI